MIVILNKIEVITTYGKLLYEAINKEVVMKKIVDRYTNNIFENIKHMDEYENEYWYARELSKVLEYKDWRNFLKVLNKAKEACNNSGFNVDEQLVEVNRLSKRNNNAIANIQDYKLSRYICYLIVQNADPSKEVVALGQTYFAIQTRKQEITEQEYDSLSDDEKRFYQRKLTRQGNYTLQKVASSAGVKNMAEFHNAVYKGLYNGETADDIFKRKKLRYRTGTSATGGSNLFTGAGHQHERRRSRWVSVCAIDTERRIHFRGVRVSLSAWDPDAGAGGTDHSADPGTFSMVYGKNI